VAALAVFVVLSSPPRQLTLPGNPSDGTVAGIIHIHSSRSDGSSTPDEIAAAAARAGLKFLVFTDHGDATRKPEIPSYRSGVLCIDGVEISTTGGHYIAIDMPAAPYPLGGEPRDVVDDVHRLGGFGIVAHPDSPKEQLRWKDSGAPFDGIEAVNLDTGWRQWVEQTQLADAPMRTRWAARGRLLAALIDYPFRPPEVIASLTSPTTHAFSVDRMLDRPELKGRRIVTTAGADAHAKLAYRGDPGEATYSLPIPSYEQTFRALSVHASTDQPLTGNAADDARLVLRAIRAGHLYAALDGVATPPLLEFTATSSAGTAREGDELQLGGEVTLHVRSNAPTTFTTTVWNGASQVGPGRHEPEFTVAVPGSPAAYWVGIQAPGERGHVMWLRSNRIFLGTKASGSQLPSTEDVNNIISTDAPQPIFDGHTTNGWHIEHEPTSVGALEIATGFSGPELRLRYGLSAGLSAGPFVTFAYDVPPGMLMSDRLTFTVRAEKPMRMSVQLRTDGGDGNRWQKSVYVSTADEKRTVFFADFVPVGAAPAAPASLADIRTILFVVDTTNTKPGSSGRLWIKSAALGE
jgi:hypothetical protein